MCLHGSAYVGMVHIDAPPRLMYPWLAGLVEVASCVSVEWVSTGNF
jgi:hypothetical protein